MTRRRSPIRSLAVPVITALCALAARAARAGEAGEAGDLESSLELVSSAAEGPGYCALVGEQAGALALVLAARRDDLVLHLEAPREEVSTLRSRFCDAGLLGSRVYVEAAAGRLPLADDLVDLAIHVGGEVGDDLRAELWRVVRPRGTVIIGGERQRKAVPGGVGDWTHPYHGADNNPQSRDRLARAPYLTRFLARPWYGPMPEVTVSAAGRLFKAFGFLAFKRREWPLVGKLIAMDAYHGTILWERDLQPGFMIHRNTLIATEDTLYLADNESCKLIDPAGGKLKGEIVVRRGEADGPSWKWMNVDGGRIYALLGESEKLHVVHRGTREQTGWPWTTVRSTYGQEQGSWGYGRNLLCIDLASREIVWNHREEVPIDGRATCMSSGRIFVYSHGAFAAAIDATTGRTVWKNDSKELLDAIGEHERAQDPRLGYATSAYLKAGDGAIYFAGPQRKRLVAVSTRTGYVLWTHGDGNVQLVLRPEGVFAMGRLSSSKQFDPLTGEVLADLNCFRGNCTRATGAVDSIFARGYRHTGTLRLDLDGNTPRRLANMRPACQDGVVIASGGLYWGPWMCDCNHSLVGVIGLSSAGDHRFGSEARSDERLEVLAAPDTALEELAVDSGDWPTYRRDNGRSGAAAVDVPPGPRRLWQWAPPARVSPTAPVCVAGLVFVAGSDGVIRALGSADGREVWRAYTGGRIFFPPAVWNHRLYVGSADGRVHCLEAKTGRALWRFRAAPAERRIPVYGRLSSTWPVASGVMLQDGLAYAAAGIASHDGTHVYALDATTGEIRWQNNETGSLPGSGASAGVSVQGHLLYHDGKVHLAGGNVVSPAVFDARSGTCLNALEQEPGQTLDDHWKSQRSSRGSELAVVKDRVVVSGPMLYSPSPRGPNSRYAHSNLMQVASGDRVVQAADGLLARLGPSRTSDGKATALWTSSRVKVPEALAMSRDAVVVAGELVKDDGATAPGIILHALDDGRVLWQSSLPGPVKRWGIALDREGRIVLTLKDGRVLAFGTGPD